MKIEVEIKDYKIFENHDPDLVWVRTVVYIDGHRNRALERVIHIDDLRSHFDIIWEDMGERIKREYKKLKESTDGS
jgi:predicted phosphatase